MPENNSGRDKSIGLLQLMDGMFTSAAVETACELGVLEFLAATPGSVQTVADALGLSERGLMPLLDTLHAIGLLTRDGDEFACTPAAAAAAPRMLKVAQRVPDLVRTGSGSLSVNTTDGSKALYGNVVGMLSKLFESTVDPVAEHLLAGGDASTILEVGAGAAPWSRALARRDSAIMVDALDLLPVLEVTRQHVSDDGLSNQYRFLSGDMFTVELPTSAYDLVLIPNVCHLFDETTNQTLLERLATSLRAGGRLAVIDILPGTTPETHRTVSLYALGLMVRTDTGGVHSESEYRRWLEGAGLGSITRWDSSSQIPISVVTGRLLHR